MSEELERRWDDAVETAWRGYRQVLADRLAEMGDEVMVGIATWEEPGVVGGEIVPLCDAVVEGDLLRIEVNSNPYLPEGMRLDDAQGAALVDLGFYPPETDDPADGETCFWADFPQRNADWAAVMLVRAVREVHGLPHPVYLETMGLEEDGAADPPAEPAATSPDLSRPIFPRSSDELRAGVDLAVRGLFDVAPEWDDDGDLPLPTAHGRVWVLVSSSRPRILLHCSLVGEVVDTTRALLEINLLNAREAGLTFAFRDGGISVSREIDLTVFIPGALQEEIDRLVHQADRWASDLVARLGGRRMDDTTVQPAPGPAVVGEPSRFTTAYAVMLELEKQERGSVPPATLVRVFHRDRALLLQAIGTSDDLVRTWKRRARLAAAKDKKRVAALARSRVGMHRDLRKRLRLALRLLVDAPLRKVTTDQLSLFDEDECDNSR